MLLSLPGTLPAQALRQFLEAHGLQLRYRNGIAVAEPIRAPRPEVSSR